MKNRDKKKIEQIVYIFMVVIIVGMLLYLAIICCPKVFPKYKIEDRTTNVGEYQSDTPNAKAVGWIRVEGTNIDYPVIKNEFGLNLSKITESFAWMDGKTDSLVNKIFILGHNIKNVSKNPLITNKNHTRFEQLLSFIYYDFAKENKYIQYTVNGKNYLYKIFAISIVEDKELDYDSATYDDKELKHYIEWSKENSFFDFNTDVNENDYIITLATCTRFYGVNRDYTFKVDARMVRKGENVANYSVKKNKNYEEIEKIMKGGVKNESKV